jgi:hypothetical protein
VAIPAMNAESRRPRLAVNRQKRRTASDSKHDNSQSEVITTLPI